MCDNKGGWERVIRELRETEREKVGDTEREREMELACV